MKTQETIIGYQDTKGITHFILNQVPLTIYYKDRIQHEIEELYRSGFRGQAVLHIPLNKTQSHWVAHDIFVDLDYKRITQITEHDSVENGRQTDNWSCGFHTMNAIIDSILGKLKTGIKVNIEKISRDLEYNYNSKYNNFNNYYLNEENKQIEIQKQQIYTDNYINELIDNICQDEYIIDKNKEYLVNLLLETTENNKHVIYNYINNIINISKKTKNKTLINEEIENIEQKTKTIKMIESLHSRNYISKSQINHLTTLLNQQNINAKDLSSFISKNYKQRNFKNKLDDYIKNNTKSINEIKEIYINDVLCLKCEKFITENQCNSLIYLIKSGAINDTQDLILLATEKGDINKYINNIIQNLPKHKTTKNKQKIFELQPIQQSQQPKSIVLQNISTKPTLKQTTKQKSAALQPTEKEKDLKTFNNNLGFLAGKQQKILRDLSQQDEGFIKKFNEYFEKFDCDGKLDLEQYIKSFIKENTQPTEIEEDLEKTFNNNLEFLLKEQQEILRDLSQQNEGFIKKFNKFFKDTLSEKEDLINNVNSFITKNTPQTPKSFKKSTTVPKTTYNKRPQEDYKQQPHQLKSIVSQNISTKPTPEQTTKQIPQQTEQATFIQEINDSEMKDEQKKFFINFANNEENTKKLKEVSEEINEIKKKCYNLLTFKRRLERYIKKLEQKSQTTKKLTKKEVGSDEYEELNTALNNLVLAGYDIEPLHSYISEKLKQEQQTTGETVIFEKIIDTINTLNSLIEAEYEIEGDPLEIFKNFSGLE